MSYEELLKAIADAPELVRWKLIEQGHYQYLFKTLTWDDFIITKDEMKAAYKTLVSGKELIE